MKIHEFILKETIDNLFINDVEKRRKYAPQVFDILQKSYAPIGGIHGNGFSDPQDMIDNIPMWKLFRRGEEVKLVMMYKDKGGRKRVAIGTDGSREAKQELAKQIRDEALSGRAFGEISGPSLGFTKKILGDQFDAIAVPYEKVIQVLKKEYEAGTIKQVSDYEYERKIGGNWHTKVMVGQPGKTIR